jgi:hypothetical protein
MLIFLGNALGRNRWQWVGPTPKKTNSIRIRGFFPAHINRRRNGSMNSAEPRNDLKNEEVVTGMEEPVLEGGKGPAEPDRTAPAKITCAEDLPPSCMSHFLSFLLAYC